MNTRKTIYGKLFKEETKLATHKVELASIQDISKRASDLSDKILNNKAILQNALSKANIEAKKYASEYDKLQNDIIKIEKQINDLGILSPKELDSAAQVAFNSFKVNQSVLENSKDIK
jgi:DNA repair exonuclease SbcCD ATPase subunit